VAGILTPPAPPYRDRDAYAAILSALKATGVFAEVDFGTSLDEAAIAADRVPLTVVTPVEWAELDDADPMVYLRRVVFSLVIVVRDEDASQRFEQLDRLTSVVQDAIDGSDLGGGCIPALTVIRRGRYSVMRRGNSSALSNHPEQRVSLIGEFTYLIPAQIGHDTSP
jgi:hypothetical protein